MSEQYKTVKFINDGIELDVNVSPKEDTIWLSQEQIAILFKVQRPAIVKHINNIYACGELDEDSTCSKMEHMGTFGKQKYVLKLYNLDMIISIGYRVNSKQGIIFRKWANKILKEYLLKGYVINENRVVVSNENYIELKNEVTNINNRLTKVETKLTNKEYDINQIFYNGEFYDAYSLIQDILESAIEEIIIIDNYIDRTILNRLRVKKKNVKVIIYTSPITSKILGIDIDKFNKQYGLLKIEYTTKVHDRYIIIDKKKLYHIGASIKDVGKKIFSINMLEYNMIYLLLSSI